MKTLTRSHSGRTVAAAEVITLVGFALYVAFPDPARGAGAVVMVLGACAVVGFAVMCGRRSPADLPVAVVAASSAVGVLGAVAYLRSLADEPSAIPIAGVGVLLLSLVGLAATSVIIAMIGVGRPVRR